jgi:CarboxypepD_reg-like domain/TonB-dependent Receptor Plug Domain
LKTKLALLFLISTIFSYAQTARVKGIVLDENNQPVENVNVVFQENRTTTDPSGFYVLTIPSNVKSNLKFSHFSLKSAVITLDLKPNEDYEFNIVLKSNVEQIGEVIITNNNRKRVDGVTTISPRAVRLIPGANAGVENILKTLPGVYSNNELSTQYAVRGGNYDENLVYVNEIEVYRPFLVRSGQQEGLSFTNTDLVQNIDFSAGGFQAKYGDKLSSVLDITYRRPTKFGASLEASFLGGSLAVETASKDQKWSSITGVRYRDNSLLVNSQETKSNFRPRFADVQTYLTFTPSTKWQFSFLGNISQNKYDYKPLTRQTNFGTIDESKALQVYYEGQEKDKYNTLFGAVKTTYTINENSNLKFITSAYHTTEQEYFDILAQYRLGEVDSSLGSDNFGGVDFSQAIGSQISHARNDLDALIVNAELKGFHKKNDNQIEWGFKYTREDIRDRLLEWEVIDSAGFSINPPILSLPNNQQPYDPYYGPLVPYKNVSAKNYVTINRFSGYIQLNRRAKWGNHDIWFNAGARAHEWSVEAQSISGRSQITFSPRLQFAIKPDWDMDMMFRVSNGFYYQPPFYRELRNVDGQIEPNVKAQQSIHYVIGNDYSFKIWSRAFKLVTEAYYKSISDVNSYTLDNVRIRYAANNNSKAYAQGLDLRLNGEFVPGTESWFSFGYLKTEENINNQGYISRPTDQRLKFGVLLQDYVPNIPAFKVYLNLVYNTGLPGGSPSYADPYKYTERLRDYRRADLGLSYVFTDRARAKQEGHWLKKYKDLSLGFEIFNMFNNQNAITNTWVRDVYTKTQYAVPNYLTTRVFSVKLNVKL